MLHTIYPHGLKPYQIYFLCFEALKEDKTIEMWDHKIKQYLTLKLTDDLHNELLFLRIYNKLKGKLSRKEIRVSLDGIEIRSRYSNIVIDFCEESERDWIYNSIDDIGPFYSTQLWI